jgi:acetyl-CoA decarbonylase/synthase complex subunit gamma
LSWGINSGGFSVAGSGEPIVAYLGAVLAGSFFTPLFLAGLPTRSFAIKGAYAGLVWALVWYCVAGKHWTHYSIAAHFLFLPVVSAFLALTFTGCTPFTSPSGVKKEMKLSFPVMFLSVILGVVLWAAGFLVGRS